MADHFDNYSRMCGGDCFTVPLYNVVFGPAAACPVVWGFPCHSLKTHGWPRADIFIPMQWLSLWLIHHIHSSNIITFIYTYALYNTLIYTYIYIPKAKSNVWDTYHPQDSKPHLMHLNLSSDFYQLSSCIFQWMHHCL